MIGDRRLLAKLYYRTGWTWWRVRGKKCNKKSGYGIQTNKGILFIPISELRVFIKNKLREIK